MRAARAAIRSPWFHSIIATDRRDKRNPPQVGFLNRDLPPKGRWDEGAVNKGSRQTIPATRANTISALHRAPRIKLKCKVQVHRGQRPSLPLLSPSPSLPIPQNLSRKRDVYLWEVTVRDTPGI